MRKLPVAARGVKSLDGGYDIDMDTRQQYAQFLLPVVARGVEPVVVVSARGRTLTADDGRTYLDCFSGISVVNAEQNA
jgi:4-aminobutyrate aminotransferase-like enzyme